MKKKFNWGNLLILILFVGSVGLFLGDTYYILKGATYSWYGFITSIINMAVMSLSGLYIWEVCYEK